MKQHIKYIIALIILVLMFFAIASRARLTPLYSHKPAWQRLIHRGLDGLIHQDF